MGQVMGVEADVANVVFVHPMGYGADFWHDAADRLQTRTGLAVHAVTLPGSAPRENVTLTVDSASATVHEAVTAHRDGGVALIGISLGARIAARFAADEPAAVDRLALLSAGDRTNPVGNALQALTLAIMPERSLTDQSPNARKPATRAALKILPQLSLGERLREITAPTLVAAARDDRGFLASSRSLAEHIPHATFHEIPRGGHFWPRSEPHEFDALIDNWLGAPVTR